MPKQTTSQKNEIKLAVMEGTMTTIQSDIKDIKATLRDLNNKIDHNFITKEELTVRDDKIKDLEDAQKWIYRLVIGAVVLTALGLLFSNRIPL